MLLYRPSATFIFAVVAAGLSPSVFNVADAASDVFFTADLIDDSQGCSLEETQHMELILNQYMEAYGVASPGELSSPSGSTSSTATSVAVGDWQAYQYGELVNFSEFEKDILKGGADEADEQGEENDGHRRLEPCENYNGCQIGLPSFCANCACCGAGRRHRRGLEEEEINQMREETRLALLADEKITCISKDTIQIFIGGAGGEQEEATASSGVAHVVFFKAFLLLVIGLVGAVVY